MDNLSSARIPFWDSMKFMLIFLVVYGHTIESFVNNSPFNQAMYNFIYLFHMPLFVYISGRFSRPKNTKQYLKGMLSILETYFVFQLFRCIKPLFIQGKFSLFPDIFIPKGILWYLGCLVLWRLIVVIVKDWELEYFRFYVLSFFLIVGLGIGFLQIHDGTLIRFFTLGFFFFLGFYLKDSWIQSSFKKYTFAIAVLLILFLWLSVFLFCNTDIRSVIYYNCYYDDNSILTPNNYLWARLLFYMFALVAGWAIMRIAYSRPYLSKYGSCTLAIFMYHTIFVSPLRLIWANETIPYNEILLFCFSIIVCYAIVYLTLHFRIMTIILNPVSFLLKNRRQQRN